MRKLFVIFTCVLLAAVIGAWAIERFLNVSPSNNPANVIESSAPPEAPVTIDNNLPPETPDAAANDETETDPLPVSNPDADTKVEVEDVAGVWQSLRFSAVGDIMLHSQQYENAKDPATGVYNFGSCFEVIAPYLHRADIMAGNLETVFGGSPYSDFPTFCAPDEFGAALKNNGFNLLVTGNNHALDKREAGLIRTLDLLEELDISFTGTARSQQERDTILILEHNGIRLAVLSYTYSTNGIPVPAGKEYLINVLSEELVISDLARAKELKPDFIIVLPHMGDEYSTSPSGHWQQWVKIMFENGADIVLAHHPHVIQPFEIIEVEENGVLRTCVVAYSMGNFVSGQRTIPRDEGVIINIEFEKFGTQKARISKITFIPTWVMYTNDQGMREIKVLPIGEVLLKVDDKKLTEAFPSPVDPVISRLRPMDITRMRTALGNIKRMMYGDTASSDDSVQIEYTIYTNPRD